MYYYVFNNAKRLCSLAKAKKFDELVEELKSAKLVECHDYHGIKTSGKEVYRNICNAIALKEAKDVLDKVNNIVIPLFVEKWDAEALLMVAKDPTLYGPLTQAAKDVLDEYNYYRAIAIKAYDDRVTGKHCVVRDFTLDEPVRIEYITGGNLSFFKNDIEYVVYFSEDI